MKKILSGIWTFVIELVGVFLIILVFSIATTIVMNFSLGLNLDAVKVFVLLYFIYAIIRFLN